LDGFQRRWKKCRGTGRVLGEKKVDEEGDGGERRLKVEEKGRCM
jgi:hypothetical protein